MDTIQINNLSEYIYNLEQMDEKNFLFRGESDNYEELLASVFREKNNNYYNFKQLYSDYYREIAYSLSEIERENFLAYSQHHGLPTPLIDISENPLTALYFACSSNSNLSNGYVYLFDKSSCIPYDIFEESDLSCAFNMSGFTSYKSQMNLLIHLSSTGSMLEELLIDLLKKFSYINTNLTFGGNEFLDTMNSIKAILSITSCNRDTLNNIIVNLEKNNVILNQIQKYTDFIEKYDKKDIIYPNIYNLDYQSERRFTLKVWWIYLLNLYISRYHILDAHVRFNKNSSYSLIPKPLIPPVLYKTKINFDRLKSQSGLFFYQLNTSFPIRKPIIQQIKKDKVFIINNKSKILEQLDQVGVNRKSLFLDPDNIAQYISFKQINYK